MKSSETQKAAVKTLFLTMSKTSFGQLLKVQVGTIVFEMCTYLLVAMK